MASTTQYTIRGVEPRVDRILRALARERRMSLNRYLLQELGHIAGQAEGDERHHDMDFAIGSMKDGELVDRAVEEFEQVDEGLWV